MSSPTTAKKLGAIVAAALVTAVGVIWLSPWGAYRQLQTRNYTPVEGKLIRRIIDADNYLRGVEYTYEVAGERYVSNRFSYVASDIHFDVEEYCKMRAGDPITVFVDPHQPEKSVIIRGLSRTAYFNLSWLGLGLLALLIGIVQLCSHDWPKADYLDQYRGRVEYVNGCQRIRMVPQGDTAWSSAVTCFVATALTVLAIAFAGDRWLDWWNMNLLLTTGLAFVAGLAVGFWEYHHIEVGNSRGRWDLVVDKNKEQLQVPAVRYWGSPTTIRFDRLIGFKQVPLFSTDDDGGPPVYALVLHYVANRVDCDCHVARSYSQTELSALADWIREATDLPLIDIPNEVDVAPALISGDCHRL